MGAIYGCGCNACGCNLCGCNLRLSEVHWGSICLSFIWALSAAGPGGPRGPQNNYFKTFFSNNFDFWCRHGCLPSQNPWRRPQGPPKSTMSGTSSSTNKVVGPVALHLYPAVLKTIGLVVAKIVACFEDSTSQSSTAASTSTRPRGPNQPGVVEPPEDALDRYLLASRGGSSDAQARFCRAVPSR